MKRDKDGTNKIRKCGRIGEERKGERRKRGKNREEERRERSFTFSLDFPKI